MAIYSDINYMNPSKGPIVEDVDDVYQAVFTLLDTKVGTRVFRPTYGSVLSNYLFEPCDEISASNIFYDILTIFNQEPRVQINTAKTEVTPDPLNNRFLIYIVFNILGFSETEKTMQLVLKTKNQSDKG